MKRYESNFFSFLPRTCIFGGEFKALIGGCSGLSQRRMVDSEITDISRQSDFVRFGHRPTRSGGVS